MKVLVFTNMYPFPGMPYYGSFVKDEVEALKRRNIEVDVLFVNGIRTKWSYAASPFRFRSAIGRKDYDIVHVHHSFCGFVATFQKRIPVVWTFHEGEIMSSPSFRGTDRIIKRLAYSKSFKRAVARRVNAVVVVSERLKEPLGREDAVTIASGIDLDLFAPTDRDDARKQVGWQVSKRYVLFPSAPSRPEKRFTLAREAVRLLGATFGEVELRCLENIAHEKVPLYMSAADLLLMTSSFEASPVTIREALACNLPVVSTDVGDVSDVLRGVEGCYVVPDDPPAIAEALRKALRRGGRIEGRGKVSPYSVDRTAEKLLEVYAGIAKPGEATDDDRT